MPTEKPGTTAHLVDVTVAERLVEVRSVRERTTEGNEMKHIRMKKSILSVLFALGVTFAGPLAFSAPPVPIR
jgi:hypothetical protein